MADVMSFEIWLMSEYAIDYDSFSNLSRYEKNSIKDAYNEYCAQNNETVTAGGV